MLVTLLCYLRSISLELAQLSVHLSPRIRKNSMNDRGHVRADVRPRNTSSRSELNVLSIRRRARFGMNDASSWGVHFSEKRNDLAEFHRPKKRQLFCRTNLFFLLANIPIPYYSFLRRRKESLERAMNRNRSLVFDHRDIVRRKKRKMI